MQLSDGLSKLVPTLFLYALFSLGASFQALAMKEAEMGITYVLVIGLEVVLAVLFSIPFFKEGYSLVKFLGIGFVTVGVILLRTGHV